MSEFEAKPWAQWFDATPDHKPDYVEMVEQEVRQLMESRGLPKDDKNIEHALACAYMRGIDSVDKYLRNSLSAYRNSARGPQWISVKERLPTDVDGVTQLWMRSRSLAELVLGCHAVMFEHNEKIEGVLDMNKPDGLWDLSDFTHWMPLPKPPEDK